MRLDRVEHERAAVRETEPEARDQAAGEPNEPEHALLGLQRDLGNVRTARIARELQARRESGGLASSPLLQRSILTDIMSFGHDVAEGLGLESSFDANLARAQLFVDGGPYGPKDVAPGEARTGGGFEAEYDPAVGVMAVRMRCSVTYKHGLDDETTPGTVIPADASLTALATRAMDPSIPLADRQALIQRYKWQDAEKEPWRDQLRTRIETAWSTATTGIEFHLNKPQWEWIGAKVNVEIDVHETPKGGRNPDDHLEISTIKFPAGENLYTRGGISWTSEGASQTDPRDQTMQLASTDIGPRPDYNVLRTNVTFDIDSADLDADAQTFLKDWIATFQGKPGDPRSQAPKITLEAHTSATGSEAHNLALSKRRAESVRKFLNDNGFTDVVTRVKSDARGEAGARGGENEDERRVDLIVGDGSAQVLAVHEFGHAFGLDDEYADTPLYGGSGAAVGDPASHDKAVKEMQDDTGAHLAGAIHEETEGIMSAGNVIRPQHYSMFHRALVEITDESEWALGPPHAFPTAPGAAGPGTGAAPAPGTPGTAPATPTPGP